MSLSKAEHVLKILAAVTGTIAVITVTWTWIVTVKRQNQLATEIVAAASSPTPAPAVIPEEAPSVPVATAAPVAARTPLPPRPVVPAPIIPAAVAGGTGPLSTPYGTKSRQFRYKNPNAQSVFLAGNFNQWKPEQMKMDNNGTWFIEETLPRGVTIEYQYIVDGARIADPWGAIPSEAADNGTLKSAYIIPITHPTPRPRTSTPTPSPADSNVPKITPVPIIAPVPMGGVPETAPSPASDAVDLAALASTPGDWPKTVTIKQAGIVFPVILDGKVAGQIQATPGMQVSLVKVTPNQLTISFQGAMQVVPVSATDLIERVQASRKH